MFSENGCFLVGTWWALRTTKRHLSQDGSALGDRSSKEELPQGSHLGSADPWKVGRDSQACCLDRWALMECLKDSQPIWTEKYQGHEKKASQEHKRRLRTHRTILRDVNPESRSVPPLMPRLQMTVTSTGVLHFYNSSTLSSTPWLPEMLQGFTFTHLPSKRGEGGNCSI